MTTNANVTANAFVTVNAGVFDYASITANAFETVERSTPKTSVIAKTRVTANRMEIANVGVTM